ncbi:MAG: nucleotide exchange factor GrpE [Phycisphaerae bacterium]|nr:nucleotide exchange factor GrpE [Phycisphaerae bacterium]
MTSKKKRKHDRDREFDETDALQPTPESQPESGSSGEAPPNEPLTPDDELEQLRAERDGLLQRLQRLSADYRNYQKRVQRDIAHARDYANEELIKSMLAVLDDMERALTAARENHDEDDPLLKGMQIVHDNALATLEKFGVERIAAEGEPFDPDLHQAVMQQPADEPAMTVLQEVQTGYRLKGRTIRPSSVIVSQGPGAEADGTAPDDVVDEDKPDAGD